MPIAPLQTLMAYWRLNQRAGWTTLLSALLMLGGCSSNEYRTPYPTAVTPTSNSSTANTTAPANVRHYPFDGGEIVTDVQSQRCQVSLRGAIHEETVRRLGQALNATANARCSRKQLVLDASEGSLGDAITIGSMLKNRGFQTAVRAGSTCSTSCLLVFAAGSERVVPDSPGTQLVFSQIPPDQDFGRNRCNAELTPGQSLTLARYIRAMLPEPTASAVYQKMSTASCSNTSRYGAQEAIAMGLATGTR